MTRTRTCYWCLGKNDDGHLPNCPTREFGLPPSHWGRGSVHFEFTLQPLDADPKPLVNAMDQLRDAAARNAAVFTGLRPARR